VVQAYYIMRKWSNELYMKKHRPRYFGTRVAKNE